MHESCPFCNGRVVVTHKTRGFRAECENRNTSCPMNMRTHHFETEEEALEAWDTRA